MNLNEIDKAKRAGIAHPYSQYLVERTLRVLSSKVLCHKLRCKPETLEEARLGEIVFYYKELSQLERILGIS